MNIKKATLTLIVAAASFGAVASHAAKGENYPPEAHHGKALTRAAVLEDLKRARAEGQVTHNDLHYPIVRSHGPAASRAQVRNELIRARAAGELNVIERS